MKKNILFLLLACFALSINGQNTAKNILDKTENAFRKAGGIESAFSIKVYRGNALNGTTQGVLKIDGRKFYLVTPENITWFDGETQWTYLPGSDEVNITTPTEEELQEINPYAILSLYNKEYSSELGKTNNYLGKPVTEVILKANDKNRNISKITAYLDGTYLPLFIIAELQDGSRNEITVSSNKTKQKYENSVFVFPQDEYPSAELIDLR